MRTAQLIDEERQSRIDLALQAFGQSLQEYGYQQQLLNSLNRPRTCYRVGASFTCY